ncbi:MAG: PrgI family protein [Lachnospiraceae bacterium]|nr:PrgI family protein [Lachnospiraceae bacterium]
MAYVTVPKDLDRVKNKVAFNLTLRQAACIGLAASAGVPFYFLTRDAVGASNAASGMVILMLPVFFFALYEKDGLPLEKVLMNAITVHLLRPAERRYEREAGEAGKRKGTGGIRKETADPENGKERTGSGTLLPEPDRGLPGKRAEAAHDGEAETEDGTEPRAPAGPRAGQEAYLDGLLESMEGGGARHG